MSLIPTDWDRGYNAGCAARQPEIDTLKEQVRVMREALETERAVAEDLAKRLEGYMKDIDTTRYKAICEVIEEWEKPYGLTDGTSLIDRLHRMRDKAKALAQGEQDE